MSPSRVKLGCVHFNYYIVELHTPYNDNFMNLVKYGTFLGVMFQLLSNFLSFTIKVFVIKKNKRQQHTKGQYVVTLSLCCEFKYGPKYEMCHQH